MGDHTLTQHDNIYWHNNKSHQALWLKQWPPIYVNEFRLWGCRCGGCREKKCYKTCVNHRHAWFILKNSLTTNSSREAHYKTQPCHSCCIVYRHWRHWDIFASFTFRCFQGHSWPVSGQPSVSSRPMRRPVIGASWPCPLLSTLELTGEMPSQTQ